MQKTITILLLESHGRLRSELAHRVKSRWPEVRVLEAEDGAAGIALQILHQPEVVVTDVVLPVMGGLDVIAEVKRIHPAAKVIVFSLYSNSQFRDSARQLGALAYIGKEQPLEDILGAIEAALTPGGLS